MKKLLLILTLCFAQSVVAQSIAVMSYNIRQDVSSDAEQGNGWQGRKEVVCGIIRSNDVDILGCQEVLNNQLEDMQGELEWYDYVGVGRDDGKKAGEYSPIFYARNKFQRLDSGHFWLSEKTDHPNRGWDAALPRICTWVKLKINDGGKTIWVFNLHFDHVGVVARRESTRLVLSKIAAMRGTDEVVLMGDFNVDQNNESYLLIENSGVMRDSYNAADVRFAPNGTFNWFNPNYYSNVRIDHIFVSRNLGVDRYRILTDTYRTPVGDYSREAPWANNDRHVARTPSDHFPVLVNLHFAQWSMAL